MFLWHETCRAHRLITEPLSGEHLSTETFFRGTVLAGDFHGMNLAVRFRGTVLAVRFRGMNLADISDFFFFAFSDLSWHETCCMIVMAR